MTDRYRNFANSSVGRGVSKRLGLPRPAELRRYTPGRPAAPRPGPVDRDADAGQLGGSSRGSSTRRASSCTAATTGRAARPRSSPTRPASRRSPTWRSCSRACPPPVKRLEPSGRLLLARPPSTGSQEPGAGRGPAGPRRLRPLRREGAAGRRHGQPRCSSTTAPTTRSSRRCASSCPGAPRSSTARSSRVAGAARPTAPPTGLGRSTAGSPSSPEPRRASVRPSPSVLARDGARVVCADLPAQGEPLAAVANRIGGTALQVDITATAARRAHRGARHRTARPARRARAQRRHHPRQAARQHDAALGVGARRQPRGAAAHQRRAADDRRPRSRRRVVCASSTSGIAGNRGQTNYAASKAGIIGMVRVGRTGDRRARRAPSTRWRPASSRPT